MVLPEYKAGSLVNLMASIEAGLGDETPRYAPLPGLDPSRLRRARRVVLLVVDGLGYDLLVRAGGDGALHRRLEGKITSVFPSTTAAALATILTGAAPQQHALTGWFVNVPELGGVTAILPCRPRVGGAPRGHAGVDAAKLFDQVPLVDRLRARSCGRARGSPGPSSTRHTAAGPSGGRIDRREASSARSSASCANRIPASTCTPTGPSSTVLRTSTGSEAPSWPHLAEFDRAFEAFLRTIAGSGSLVIVTGDHGLIDSGPDRLIELDCHRRSRRRCGCRSAGIGGRLTATSIRSNGTRSSATCARTRRVRRPRREPGIGEQGYFGLGRRTRGWNGSAITR
jgi:hypothetical protein